MPLRKIAALVGQNSGSKTLPLVLSEEIKDHRQSSATWFDEAFSPVLPSFCF